MRKLPCSRSQFGRICMVMISRSLVFAIGLGFSLFSQNLPSSASEPPPTVAKVDLDRYIGRWYEIARLPMAFQKANEAARAEYGKNADGTVSVHNTAVRPDGTEHGIKGYAKVLNPPQNSKLAVRFKTWFGPLIPVPKQGNYWVLHVDDKYQEAIVGTPNRKFLWILSRTEKLPEFRYQALVKKAKDLGYDVSRLIKDPRP